MNIGLAKYIYRIERHYVFKNPLLFDQACVYSGVHFQRFEKTDTISINLQIINSVTLWFYLPFLQIFFRITPHHSILIHSCKV